MSQIQKNHSETLMGLLLIVVFYFGVKFVQDIIRPKSWDLFVYYTQSPDLSHQKTRINGFKSLKTCINEAFKITTNNGSFECGYDCYYRDEYKTEICGKICDSAGCRD